MGKPVSIDVHGPFGPIVIPLPAKFKTKRGSPFQFVVLQILSENKELEGWGKEN